ncbi:hypothetical protein SynROS8604_01038 [Synechococcus sp. ROS8604]|nr:hypothetical protein SynROS8604_01038 [Synechococcus sp. ROS8604]
MFIDLFCAVGGASGENGLIDNVAFLELVMSGLTSPQSSSLGRSTGSLNITSALVVSVNR